MGLTRAECSLLPWPAAQAAGDRSDRSGWCRWMKFYSFWCLVLKSPGTSVAQPHTRPLPTLSHCLPAPGGTGVITPQGQALAQRG